MSQLKSFLRNSLRAGFPSFVFCFSSLAFFCAAFYTLHPHYNFGFHEVYALGLIFAAALTAAASIAGRPAVEPVFSRRETAIAIGIFLFGLALGLYRISSLSIWLDEGLQADVALGRLGSSIVSQAAGTQQMPLSYYFTALNLSLFGMNEIGMRLFPCLFIAGSGILFYRLAKRICRHPLVYTVAPIIYLLSPWMIRYSQEGRPYGCMVFCGLLWLNAVHDLFAESGEAGLRRGSWQILFSCTLLFFLSAAFQPVVFATSFLPVFGWLLFRRQWRKNALASCGMVALSILMVWPLIQLARSSSSHYLYVGLNWSSFERAQAGLFSILTNVRMLFLDQSAFLALAVLFAPITVSRPLRREGAQLWAGIAGLLFFFTGFLAVFMVLINYQIFVRYYLIAYPLGLLVIISFFDQVAAFFDKEKKDRYLGWAWQTAFLAALLAPQIRSLPAAYSVNSFDRWNTDYRELYHYLKVRSEPGDVAYVIPYQDPNAWEQQGFIMTQFYFRERANIALESNWQIKHDETVSDLILRDLGRKKPGYAYLVFVNTGWGENPLFKYCSSRLNMNLHFGDGFVVCRLPIEKSLAQALDDFLSGAIQFLGKSEKAYRMFDILLGLAEHEKRPAKCSAYLEELKKIKSDKQKIQSLINTHEARCGAIPGI